MARRPARRRLIAPNGRRIVGLLATVSVIMPLDNISRTEAGSIDCEHSEGYRVEPHTAFPQRTPDGRLIYLAEDGSAFPEDELIEEPKPN